MPLAVCLHRKLLIYLLRALYLIVESLVCSWKPWNSWKLEKKISLTAWFSLHITVKPVLTQQTTRHGSFKVQFLNWKLTGRRRRRRKRERMRRWRRRELNLFCLPPAGLAAAALKFAPVHLFFTCSFKNTKMAKLCLTFLKYYCKRKTNSKLRFKGEPNILR